MNINYNKSRTQNQCKVQWSTQWLIDIHSQNLRYSTQPKDLSPLKPLHAVVSCIWFRYFTNWCSQTWWNSWINENITHVQCVIKVVLSEHNIKFCTTEYFGDKKNCRYYVTRRFRHYFIFAKLNWYTVYR